MKADEFLNADKSNEQAFRVAYLIAAFVQQDLTDAEENELDDWVGASMDNQRLFEQLTDPDNLDKWIKWKEKLPGAETLDRLKSKLEFSDAPKKKSVIRSLWPYVAAAIVLIAVAIVFTWKPDKNKPNITVRTAVNDIAPGGNHATLTLSDGKTITLDAAADGNLAREGSTNINKEDSGRVSYTVTNPSVSAGPALMNTITTPYGGTYALVLPDGSKVILNAHSTLRFPTAFAGKKRSVTLTGEGYFEVAKDPMFPFEVLTGNNNITVLGTHFNINAYGDEPFLKVTLAEGSVRLNNATTLLPGQQALVNAAMAVKVLPADMEKELAWKNGQFLFKETQLPDIMRQVARWYNCEVKFDATIADHFTAAVPRNVPVSRLLNFLQGTGRVHFNIDDKKITVMP